MMVGSDVTIINGGGLQVTNTCVMPEVKENALTYKFRVFGFHVFPIS